MTDDTSDIENNTFIEDKQAFTQTVASPTTTFPRFKLLQDDTFFPIQITEFAYNDSTVINNSGAAGSFSSLPLSLSLRLSLSCPLSAAQPGRRLRWTSLSSVLACSPAARRVPHYLPPREASCLWQ